LLDRVGNQLHVGRQISSGSDRFQEAEGDLHVLRTWDEEADVRWASHPRTWPSASVTDIAVVSTRPLVAILMKPNIAGDVNPTNVDPLSAASHQVRARSWCGNPVIVA
jgi:hypothetical protein